MRNASCSVAILFVLLYGGAALCDAQKRPAWTSSRIIGTPQPPLPFTTERVYPTLTFSNPVDTACLAGTDWLYVLELGGKVFAFDGSRSEPQPKLVFDAKSVFAEHNHSYGITFHPQVADNRFVFLSWTLPGNLVEDGTHVSRFQLSDEQPPRIRPETRQDVIRWPSGGHNGGCLKFGPDGFLYVSAGDGVGPFPPDTDETGQDLGDLRATIFRIDVDARDAARHYAIPSDNPFRDVPSARPEVWAYGFRNPWKMNFSPANGDLFAGDVGWELWEMIYRVEKGGNYGWSVMEGRQPVRSDVPRGPTPILPPLVDHPHTEARSITGGYVYRGSRLPELDGAYVYGDYVTGKVWGLRNDGNTVQWQAELADTPLAIITFGETERGDLFIVDYAGGLYRLVENPRRGHQSDFPRRLSETGLFSDVAAQAPAAGVLPYSIIAEPWMEGATAQRFVALPDNSSITPARNREQWTYPSGAVFAKTISLPEPEGGVRAARKLETQLLHFDGEQWHAYTYAWNNEQTDATLVPAEGAQRRIVVDGEERTWRLHSRAECNTCHTPRGGFTLGFFPQNLARAAGSPADQLATLTELGVFDSALPPRDLRPPAVDPYDVSADLDARARSWLMVNCAHCHRRGGGGTAAIEFPLETSLEQTNAVNAVPTQGTFNIPQARIITPGDPYRSVLYYRLATVGRGHMPHLGTRHVDDTGLALIHDWIAQWNWSTGDNSSAAPSSQKRRAEAPPPDDLMVPLHGADAARSGEISESLLRSTPQALRLVHAIGAKTLDSPVADAVIAAGAKHEDPIISGLFERFLPESARTRRLGTTVDPKQILALNGDAGRGRGLFMTGEGVQCRNCHRIGEHGRDVGPSLSDVGKRLDRRQLLESILDPSRRIDAQWVAHTLVTADGQVLTGLLRARSQAEIVLQDAQGQSHRIPAADVDELVAQQKSLMPELLIQDLTAAQLADLLAFLADLK